MWKSIIVIGWKADKDGNNVVPVNLYTGLDQQEGRAAAAKAIKRPNHGFLKIGLVNSPLTIPLPVVDHAPLSVEKPAEKLAVA